MAKLGLPCSPSLMTGDPVSWNRSMVSRMAASYNSPSSSSEHRRSLNSRIPRRSSGGLGMLPIGSVGMDMTRNLLPQIGVELWDKGWSSFARIRAIAD